MRNTMLRRLGLGALALGLTLALTPRASADKYDKKLEKQVKKALAAALALPETATVSDPAVTEALAAIEAFGAQDNDKAAELLMKLGFVEFKSPSVEVAVFGAVKNALASMRDEGARAEMAKTFEKSRRNWQVQMVLADVFSNMDDDKTLFAMMEMVKDKKTDDRVVAEVARSLAKRKDKRSVRDLIEAFGLWKDRGGVTFRAIADSLFEITGQRFTDVMDWEAFWDPREETFDPATAPKEEIGGTTERRAPKLFGSEVISKRVVIIIDVSGSMAIKDPGPVEDEDGEEIEGEGSVEREKKPMGGTPAPPPYTGPPVGPDSPDYNKLPVERMRIERAKKQLRRLVQAFEGDAQFNLVQFSTDARAWKPAAILPAAPANKADALKFIENLKPNGVTQAYKALTEAFKCTEADTIYFISDGSPTDDAGQPLDNAGRQALLDKISQLNKFRRVKVNTIGLRGSSPGFMRALSDLTGGEYKQVD